MSTVNINKLNSVYVVIYLEISYLKFSSKYIISRDMIKIIYLLLSIRVYQNSFLQMNYYYTSTTLKSSKFNFCGTFLPILYVNLSRYGTSSWEFGLSSRLLSCNHLMFTFLDSRANPFSNDLWYYWREQDLNLWP